MRNVTIWDYNDVVCDLPPFARLYTYKGNKRTLNEFLYPAYIYRDGHLAPRSLDDTGVCTPFDLNKKGQAVFIGYSSEDDMVNGRRGLYMVFNSFEQAVNWMFKNGYDFYGEESSTARRRKVKNVDFYAERKKYLDIAHQYEQSKKSVLIKPCVSVAEEASVVDNSDLNQAIKSLKPTPPTPPASRVLNDQGAPVGVDPELPPILQYPPKVSDSRKSFFRRLMDFLTK
ncbi:hypothetical protein PI33_gp107 [Escherichia phage ECML-4]|uniref:Uncharacterized protein n=4 Tax=Kuttervirus TaxID=2169536 RepID=G9IIN3_9CAUD|nr:hypothetical protein F371_gp044 [Escherichia phage PhaxI]YP_009101503.1 hypothetical protein PI33_gp107 [Escherichia phage ECML-4]YP_009883101.1 hypothetical protein HYP88_gp012 [Salmonella phage SS9]EDL7894968.1 hypothetical protein [Salmonella enterica subsp. enterica serovar Typhimurium]QEI24121.1 hypothetical protein [Salmonella phage SS3]AEW24359.1 hypothetical protein [Escherichia phage PhaxI]AFO10342.1 hypothetical protein [Escherichia phage ECML-4]QEI24177.1 hypothetical protein [